MAPATSSSVTDNNFADSYDSLGRAEHTREHADASKFLTATRAPKRRKLTVTETDTQDYDAFNQVVQKTGHLIEIADGDRRQRNSDTTWTGSYDNQGRASAFDNHEDTRILDATGALLMRNAQLKRHRPREHHVQRSRPAGELQRLRRRSNRSTPIGAASRTAPPTPAPKENLRYNQDAQLIHMDTVNGMKNGESYSSVYDVTAFSFNGDATQWTRTDHLRQRRAGHHHARRRRVRRSRPRGRALTQHGVADGAIVHEIRFQHSLRRARQHDLDERNRRNRRGNLFQYANDELRHVRPALGTKRRPT